MSSRCSILCAVAAAVLLSYPACAAERRDLDDEVRRLQQGKERMYLDDEVARARLRVELDGEVERIRRTLEQPAASGYGSIPLRIAGAQYRVAVFTYEDPDRTGLGNVIAALMAHEILMKSRVRGIGVLRYEGSLSRSAASPLSYFDKVELVARAQQVPLAVWGAIRRTGSGLEIDSFTQILPEARDTEFSWRLRMPRDSGGGVLRARVGPDRILAQRLAMPEAGVKRLQGLDTTVNELRSRPSDDAPVIGQLPIGSMYSVITTEGSWARISRNEGPSGWLRTEDRCRDECKPLLDAARFASSLLEFMDRRSVPQPAAGWSDDARTVVAQLRAIKALEPEAESRKAAVDAADEWIRQAGVAIPGGASFSNIKALASVVSTLDRSTVRRLADAHRKELALRRQLQDAQEELIQLRTGMPSSPSLYQGTLDRSRTLVGELRNLQEESAEIPGLSLKSDEALRIAFELAAASQSDPSNIDTLNNLAILFRAGGDAARSDLARDIAKKSSTRN